MVVAVSPTLTVGLSRLCTENLTPAVGWKDPTDIMIAEDQLND